MAATKNILNVIFDSGKGICTTASKEVTTGEAFGILPRPSREGYIFDGWFTAPEGKADAVKVTSTDIVETEDDVRLYAHWIRRQTQKKKSLFKKQVVALCVILGLVLVLAIATPIVMNLVINAFTYTETDANGVTYKYVIRKSDGVYVMKDKSGKILFVNEDGCYTTEMGTLIKVDGSTGAYKIYAVVDTEGSEVVGTSDRILMFPQMTQAVSGGNENTIIGNIEVHNEKGTYTVYRKSDTIKFTIKGFEENPLVTVDPTLIAQLCVSSGYTISMQKLNTKQVLENGYAEYGFIETVEGGEKKVTSKNWYTVTSRNGQKAYTVYIGDELVSGGGYYVKLEGRDAIYILSNSLAKTILQPVESLVTAVIVTPMSTNTYFNVTDFAIFDLKYQHDADGNLIKDADSSTYKYDLSLGIAFSFIDMDKRTNTLYSAQSFTFSEKYKDKLTGVFASQGYAINSDNCSSVLQSFYTMTFVRVAKLGLANLTDEEWAQYGMDCAEHIISFDYHLDTNEDNVLDSSVYTLLWISAKTKDNTYYIMSPLTDMIVEVEESYLNYLEWGDIEWLDKYFYQNNIAFATEVKVESGDKTIDFTLDNSATDQTDTIGSSNIKIYADGKQLEYSIATTSATGRPKTVSGVDNFRQFYKALLWASIEGEADLTAAQMQAFKDAGDNGCQLKLTIHVEDQAASRNPNYTTNNSKDLVIRFYQYSERRSFMTINGEGEFYVLSSFVDKLLADANRVLNQELIDSTSKY